MMIIHVHCLLMLLFYMWTLEILRYQTVVYPIYFVVSLTELSNSPLSPQHFSDSRFYYCAERRSIGRPIGGQGPPNLAS